MKLKSLLLPILLLATAAQSAEVPPPEKLLPADTLGVITVPDFAKARAVYRNSAVGQLWNDPSMKPFREKFMAKWKTDVIEPMEKEFGIRFNDYADLAQGQLTMVVTPNGWQGKADQLPAFMLLIDSRDKSGQLKKVLADVRKKWVDAGKKMRTEKIRDIEFTTLIISPKDLQKSLDKALPGEKSDAEEKEPGADTDSKDGGKPVEMIVGQADSLLIVGTVAQDIEKVLARLSGGSVPALAEQETFAADYSAFFRGALEYGWINFKPIYEVIAKQVASEKSDDDGGMAPSGEKILAATGLGGLKSLAFSLADSPEGLLLQGYLGVPGADRKGVFKLIANEAKDAAPPPFVPADAIRYNRWRLDLQKFWNTLEATLIETSPQMGGIIKLFMETVGKDKDPGFDLRKNLIGNFGDDIVSYQKKPRGSSAAELQNPPALYLIGSPNADQLLQALKTLTALLPPGVMKVEEREFLGRKIQSVDLPPMGGAEGPRKLSFTSGNGYLAITIDEAILEEFLRSSETKPKPLAGIPGLAEAAQKIGGMGTGLFSYENSQEMIRSMFEVLKKDNTTLASLAGLSGTPIQIDQDTEKKFKEWVDLALLPAFDQVAKYFYFTVSNGGVTPSGFTYKVFSPTPPLLKK